MGRKRKRREQTGPSQSFKYGANQASKRIRIETLAAAEIGLIGRRLLSYYYPHVQTLGAYLLGRLDEKHHFRRRVQRLAEDDELADLLTSTLVGSFRPHASEIQPVRTRDFQDFTQLSSGSVATSRRISGGPGSTLGDGTTSLSELVDFAIWSLFTRRYRSVARPPHVLCNGFAHAVPGQSTAAQAAANEGFIGVRKLRRNVQVDRIKADDWVRLLQVLGKGGDYVVVDLLLDCGVFIPADADADNYLQLSGVSLAEMPTLDGINKASKAIQANSGPRTSRSGPLASRLPSQISFVRNRMFYSRAALNGKGEVHFGLRHIHVLNRYPKADDIHQTRHVMKYLFPRQFFLHNVFVSHVDRRETSQAFKDYTMREEEIGAQSNSTCSRLPKRLRGECVGLVQKLQRSNKRCAYSELIKHYCPVPQLDRPDGQRKPKTRTSVAHSSQRSSAIEKRILETQSDRDQDLVDLATPVTRVSAFVRAVVGQILPIGFLGHGADGIANWKQLYRSIDLFVKCKRFENITLATVSSGITVSKTSWLRPSNIDAASSLSRSDHSKRCELMHEFLYYVFDSIVIPLVRDNFYVTESNDHRYRLFYFRHDVWRLATEPSIAELKCKMYEELTPVQAREVLNERPFGFSQIRLLPKRSSVRPITNLKRRLMVRQNGKSFLQPSINSVLKGVFSMLNYEKHKQPDLLGSAMLSPTELYPRLVDFRKRLALRGLSDAPLYFVKVDVQSCFDSIPQNALMEFIESICQRASFTIKHHAQIRTVAASMNTTFENTANSKPEKRFNAMAHSTSLSQQASFHELLTSQYSTGKKGLVFVEGALQKSLDPDELLDLLDDHVKRNLVRIGKKYYRQKNGIPQGSILSTLLCSFFYGNFEKQKLDFLQPASSQGPGLLLRLVDDFLLITTDRANAERFLGVMLAGDKAHGISIKEDKTTINFGSDAMEAGSRVRVIDAKERFPWCGMFIEPASLAITRDRPVTSSSAIRFSPTTHTSSKDGKRHTGRLDLADYTTAEVSKRPGAAFYRKTLASVRMNVRSMYLDTRAASMEQVRAELSKGLAEVAEKSSRYLSRLRDLSRRTKQNGVTEKMVRKCIEDVVKLTIILARTKRLGMREGNDGVTDKEQRSISRRDVERIVAEAFVKVLSRQQTRYRGLLVWLRARLEAVKSSQH